MPSVGSPIHLRGVDGVHCGGDGVVALGDDGGDLLLLGDATHHRRAQNLDPLLLAPLQAVQQPRQRVGVISTRKVDKFQSILGEALSE